MSTKPCIQCGKECEVLPVQLGDIFTLSYLRVCGAECMFLVAYDFMRDELIHKQFRNKLYELQNEEDNAEARAWVKTVTDESLRMMAEHFKENPNILSTPAPSCIAEMFAAKPEIPCAGPAMRFTRPKLKDRIKWAKEHIDRLNKDLRDAQDHLEKLENEPGNRG